MDYIWIIYIYMDYIWIIYGLYVYYGLYIYIYIWAHLVNGGSRRLVKRCRGSVGAPCSGGGRSGRVVRGAILAFIPYSHSCSPLLVTWRAPKARSELRASKSVTFCNRSVRPSCYPTICKKRCVLFVF